MDLLDQETITDVERLIRTGNVAGVWDSATINGLALLDLNSWFSMREKLVRAFGRRLLVTKLDRAVEVSRKLVQRDEVWQQEGDREAKQTIAAAVIPLNDAEADTIAIVDKAIADRNFAVVYRPEVTAALGKLSIGAWMVCRARLYRTFKAELGVRTLDRLIRDERKQAAPRLVVGANQWERFLGVLWQRWGSSEWLSAKQVVAWLREPGREVALPAELAAIDAAAPGSLERSFGRRMQSHRGRIGALIVTSRRNSHTGTVNWRIQPAEKDTAETQPVAAPPATAQPATTNGLPTTTELTGSDPDFTGSASTDEYVREMREQE